MRLNTSSVTILVLVCAGVIWGCTNGRLLSPVSPSSQLPSTAGTARQGTTTSAQQRVDYDGDGYDDPEPGPMPNPGQAPAPDGQIPPAQVPTVVTVNIVGTFGTGAFVPNPLQASMGSAIVWTNGDAIAHAIVLDNGTVVGSLAPGQSSAPMTLTSSTAMYRCTIHPSMTGQITDPAAPPPDPSQAPVPDPTAQPAPSEPYDDPYDYLSVGR